LIDLLFEIVSERTGYPREMLDPNLDLEADLGIDSIKRIEILNNFRKLLPEQIQQTMEASLEELAGIKTLQQLVDWMNQLDSIIPVETIVENAMSQMTTESFSAIDLSQLTGANNNGSNGKEHSDSGNGGGNGHNGHGNGNGNGAAPRTIENAQAASSWQAVSSSTASILQTASTDTFKDGKVVTRGLVRLIDAPAPNAAGAWPERALIVSAGGADLEGLNVLLKKKVLKRNSLSRLRSISLNSRRHSE
jgi:Phosphopantetheine attachment site.